MENWKILKQMDIALKLTWKHRPNFFQVSLDDHDGVIQKKD